MSFEHSTSTIEKPLELPDCILLYLPRITADHLEIFFCLHFIVLKNNTTQPHFAHFAPACLRGSKKLRATLMVSL